MTSKLLMMPEMHHMQCILRIIFQRQTNGTSRLTNMARVAGRRPLTEFTYIILSNNAKPNKPSPDGRGQNNIFI